VNSKCLILTHVQEVLLTELLKLNLMELCQFPPVVPPVPSPTGAPGTPTNVIAAVGYFAQINILWETADNTATSHLIERSTDGIIWHAIGKTSGIDNSFTDEGVYDNIKYQYRVTFPKR